MTTHTTAAHDHDDHREGLVHDLPRIVGRRRLLGLFGGVGATVALAACGTDASTSTTSGSPGGAAPAGAGAAAATVADGEIPEETAGPYPADGSNGPDVLSESGVVRQDLTTSFGSASGSVDGVPLTIRLRVYDLAGDDVTALAGAAVYLWHCDAEGAYSLYSAGAEQENWLRGVQEADEDGLLTFTTIVPGCYPGRWPHAHFEVYPSLADATTASNRLRTTQLALPQDVCEAVYADERYRGSADNLTQLSLDSDMVFADGWSLQMPTLTGSVEEGYVATLNVPV